MVIYSSLKHLLDNRPATCINQAQDVDRYYFGSKNVLVNGICFDFGIYGQRLEVIWEQSQRRRKWIFMGGD